MPTFEQSPNDATGVEYEALVGHILFKSESNVKSVCAELAANLKAQGWTKDGGDLIQSQNSILKRKRGEAELTIFVKPEKGGSEVKIFTAGLSGTASKATSKKQEVRRQRSDVSFFVVPLLPRVVQWIAAAALVLSRLGIRAFMSSTDIT
jgi:hypothetical protein